MNIVSTIKALMDKKQTLKWAFLGDSITHGLVHTHNKNSYSEYFECFIKTNLKRTNDTIVNFGVSGETTKWLNLYLDEISDHFDIYFIAFGMNDAASFSGLSADAFYANLAQAIRKLKAVNKIIILQSVNQLCQSYGIDPWRQDLNKYYQKIKLLAKEENLFYFDLEAQISNKYLRTYQVEELFADTIHPNEKMHLLWFLDLVIFLFGNSYRNLLIEQKRSPVCENNLVYLRSDKDLKKIKDLKTPFYFFFWNFDFCEIDKLHYQRNFLYHFKELFHSQLSFEIKNLLKYFISLKSLNNPFKKLLNNNYLEFYLFENENHLKTFQKDEITNKHKVYIFKKGLFEKISSDLLKSDFANLLIFEKKINWSNSRNSAQQLLRLFH